MTGIILLIGLVNAFLVLLLFYPRKTRTGLLNDAYTLEESRSMQGLSPKSLEYKLLAAGLRLRPATFNLFVYGGAAAAFALGASLLGGMVGVVAAGMTWYAANAWLEDKAKGRGKAIDKVLPIAVGRIAAGLLAGGSTADVLQDVADSLDVEGQNPLSPELALTAAEMKSKDRAEALIALGERSPSTSLSNLATLLLGYVQAGGKEYAETLMEISGRVQQILMARNRAQAKAGDVMISVFTMPVVLVLVLGYLSMDPIIKASLRAGPVQMVLGGVMIAMLAGYFIMRSMIQEAV